ncbi:ribulokinase [Kitasatospora paranensis]
MLVRVRDGEILASAVHDYPHAVIEERLPGTGAALPPDWALQHPQDWREVLQSAVPAALAASGVDPAQVVGIATDFTACTVLPTLADGTPLAETAQWQASPHAWPKLWKHHAAQPQADRINALAHARGEKWIHRYGGKISAEWQYAKALQVLEEDPAVYAAGERWIEAADWIVWQLTGTETRNTCTAGYKGIHQDGGYPTEEYLGALNPGFADFARTRLEHPLIALGARAGSLTAEAAAWTGLPEGIAVAAGNVDAHVAAPAARAVDHGQLLAIMGTSTCHVVNGAHLADVPGICGVVDGGIIDGSYGYEAGQSAVGDIFAWWLRQGAPAEYLLEAEQTGEDLHQLLTRKITGQPVGGHGLVALDWMGGNRSTLVDAHLSGVIIGITLATRPEEIYRALLEATAYGTRTIVEALEAGGVPVTEFVVTGGLRKNPSSCRSTPTCCAARSPSRSPSRAPPSAPRSTPRSPPAPTATCAPPRPRWAASSATPTSPTTPARTPTTRCSPSTGSCTTTSALAPTSSCTACARSATPPSPTTARTDLP